MMELTQEDIVTKLLSENEIIHIDRTEKMPSEVFPSNPNYDLAGYLKTAKAEENYFGNKYIFVK